MKKQGYREVDHTADWSLRVWAPTLEQLLHSAAEGMFDLLDVQAEGDGGPQQIIELSADDRESLLVSWLEELLFLLETENVIVSEVNFEDIQPNRLKASIRLASSTRLKKHIKAVTYHNLAIQTEDGQLTTEIVFDV